MAGEVASGLLQPDRTIKPTPAKPNVNEVSVSFMGDSSVRVVALQDCAVTEIVVNGDNVSPGFCSLESCNQSSSSSVDSSARAIFVASLPLNFQNRPG